MLTISFVTINKRVILWWMLSIAVLVNCFQMTNINVAIIAMVKPAEITAKNEFFNITENNITRAGIPLTEDKNIRFAWDQQEQNLILSAYYWFMWAAGLSGGVISYKYGAKNTLGLSVFVACVLSSAIPVLAAFSSKLVVAVRVLQGIFGAIGMPAALMMMIGFWAPPDERGLFSSVLVGQSLGVSVGYPLFGFVQDYFGWAYVFHITAACGTIWYVFWCFLIYETPDDHPSILQEEKEYIKKSLAGATSREKLPIPWKEMLTSVPLLINFFCGFGSFWGFLTVYLYLPTYLKNVFHLESKTIGLISGVSFLVRSFLQIVGGVITDVMIRKGMSRTKVSNIVTFFCVVIPGILLFPMFYLKNNLAWSVTLLVAYIIIGASMYYGTSVALIEMSPNFCGVTQGILASASVTTGFLSPLVFSYLSLHFKALDIWGYLFLTAGLIGVIPGMLFVLFSNSEQQPWNNPKKPVQDNNLQDYKSKDIQNNN